MSNRRHTPKPKSFQRPNTRGAKGWVYVITNVGMPGLLKVGFTMKDPDARARELAHTGNPHPYTVDYQVWVEDPYSVEQQAHRKLSGSGYQVGQDSISGSGIEWFSCKIEQAIVAIRHAAGGEYAHETFRRGEREIVEANFQREAARLRAEERVEKETTRLSIEFKKSVEDTFPPWPYWKYFLVCYVGSVILLSMLSSKMTDSQVFLSSFFFGGLAAFFLLLMREDSHLKSSAYLAMKEKYERDVENAGLHFFSCPHCAASMKIDFIESSAEGNRIKFHCQACNKDVANPLSAPTAQPPPKPNNVSSMFEIRSAHDGVVTLSPKTKTMIKESLMKLPPEQQKPTLLLALKAAKKVRESRMATVDGGIASEISVGASRQTVNDGVQTNAGQSFLPFKPACEPAVRAVPLRQLFLQIWDSDSGKDTMRVDLWESFLAELDLALANDANHPDDRRERIDHACNCIWQNRSAAYEKGLWQELDVAIAAVLNTEWRNQRCQ